MIDQETLFKIIERRFENTSDFQQAMNDILGVEESNIRRRLNGSTQLRYAELQKLVEKFSISRHELFPDPDEDVSFKYIRLDYPSIENYLRYIQGFASTLEGAAAISESKIYFVADDIPIFHYMRFPELTAFKLYSYAYDMKIVNMSFEVYLDIFREQDLLPIFRRISNAYNRIQSVEVWDDDVLETLLSSIGGKQDLNCFERSETVAMLLGQLKELLYGFRTLAESGEKDPGVKFEFFKNESINRLPYMMLSNGSASSLTLKLQIINSMNTGQPEFVEEGAKWFDATVNKSLALSMGAERQRNRYFQLLHDRIEAVETHTTS
ncbi:hypothetical protein [Sphingobacterium gobiense]|uniref:Transcription regulator BetR N-terminal domain-containing protein n=1 Tax=Sphingobacterium gobiense TaxID=1382456 RepID=A0A2S9JNM3_9SPHI|nr:hypothetical protein [Sphingobacterium gobiense]PRD54708.1 hypothetical protein C5749_14845 [Sphingobacterium gobiense]